MMDFESFLDVYGLAALFVVMLLKAIGIPIPIPADVVMLAASARAASGRLDVVSAFAALLLALSIGGVIQFSLIRGIGRKLLLRLGRWVGLSEDRLDTAARRLEQGGMIGVGLAILTPGIRSIAVPACGIAGIPRTQFTAGLVLGSSAFLALHFALGLLGGSLLSQMSVTASPAVLVAAALALLALGFLAWTLIRRRQRPNEPLRETLAAAAGAWHDATCPACLALGTIERLQLDLPHPPTVERHTSNASPKGVAS